MITVSNLKTLPNRNSCCKLSGKNCKIRQLASLSRFQR